MNLLRVAAAFAVVATAVNSAAASDGAYVVDSASVDDAGKCKVESWLSAANNSASDRIGVVAPACVAPFFEHRLDLSAAFARTRSDRAYATGVSIKAKTPIPGLDFAKNDKFGVAIAAGAVFDFTGNTTEQIFFVMPVSIRLSEPAVLLLNIGHSDDRIARLASTTWGVALELNLKPLGQEKFTLIGEVFGNDRDPRSGAQLGLRFTPVEKIDLDVIYGHNLTGEQASWLTLGMNFRF